MSTTGSGSVFPLTTVWSPPASCNSVWDYIGSDCAPPHYPAVFVTDDGYYSPGLCFDGYTSGCDMTWRSVDPGETAVISVPSGWDCSDQFFATSYYGDRYTTTVPAFEIRWVEDDLSLLETHPLKSGEMVARTTSTVRVTVTGPVATVGDNWSSTPEPTSTPDDEFADGVDEVEDTDEDDTGGSGGVPTGAVAGIAVGVALLVAILCAAAFIWYRKRHVGPAKAAADGAPDGEKTNDSSVHPGASQAGASQEILGHYQYPGPLMVQYPNAMYTPPPQVMPLYQFPPGTPPIPAQTYNPHPGISHELAGAYVQAQADISELHAVSQTPTLESPRPEGASGTKDEPAQALETTQYVKPTKVPQPAR